MSRFLLANVKAKGGGKQPLGYSLSRANEHGLVETVVQALHLLVTSCGHERYQPVCAWCQTKRLHTNTTRSIEDCLGTSSPRRLSTKRSG